MKYTAKFFLALLFFAYPAINGASNISLEERIKDQNWLTQFVLCLYGLHMKPKFMTENPLLKTYQDWMTAVREVYEIPKNQQTRFDQARNKRDQKDRAVQDQEREYTQLRDLMKTSYDKAYNWNPSLKFTKHGKALDTISQKLVTALKEFDPQNSAATIVKHFNDYKDFFKSQQGIDDSAQLQQKIVDFTKQIFENDQTTDDDKQGVLKWATNILAFQDLELHADFANAPKRILDKEKQHSADIFDPRRPKISRESVDYYFNRQVTAYNLFVEAPDLSIEFRPIRISSKRFGMDITPEEEPPAKRQKLETPLWKRYYKPVLATATVGLGLYALSKSKYGSRFKGMLKQKRRL